jgi:hypothetical protein
MEISNKEDKYKNESVNPQSIEGVKSDPFEGTLKSEKEVDFKMELKNFKENYKEDVEEISHKKREIPKFIKYSGIFLLSSYLCKLSIHVIMIFFPFQYT